MAGERARRQTQALIFFALFLAATCTWSFQLLTNAFGFEEKVRRLEPAQRKRYVRNGEISAFKLSFREVCTFPGEQGYFIAFAAVHAALIMPALIWHTCCILARAKARSMKVLAVSSLLSGFATVLCLIGVAACDVRRHARASLVFYLTAVVFMTAFGFFSFGANYNRRRDIVRLVIPLFIATSLFSFVGLPSLDADPALLPEATTSLEWAVVIAAWPLDYLVMCLDIRRWFLDPTKNPYEQERETTPEDQSLESSSTSVWIHINAEVERPVMPPTQSTPDTDVVDPPPAYSKGNWTPPRSTSVAETEEGERESLQRVAPLAAVILRRAEHDSRHLDAVPSNSANNADDPAAPTLGDAEDLSSLPSIRDLAGNELIENPPILSPGGEMSTLWHDGHRSDSRNDVTLASWQCPVP